MSENGRKILELARRELHLELELSDKIEKVFSEWAEREAALVLERFQLMAEIPAETLTWEEKTEILALARARQVEARRRCGMPDE